MSEINDLQKVGAGLKSFLAILDGFRELSPNSKPPMIPRNLVRSSRIEHFLCPRGRRQRVGKIVRFGSERITLRFDKIVENKMEIEKAENSTRKIKKRSEENQWFKG
jgi:hypothetical protein